jgi:hypothetical protein
VVLGARTGPLFSYVVFELAHRNIAGAARWSLA